MGRTGRVRAPWGGRRGRRPGRRPGVALARLAGLLGTAVLAGCGLAGSVEAGTAQGCGACEEETEAILEEIGRLEGAVLVEGTYSAGDHDAGPRLEVDIEVAEPPGEDVAEEVAKIGWHSDIRELESVTVVRTTPDGKKLEPMFWLLAGGPEIEERTARKWGPRD